MRSARGQAFECMATNVSLVVSKAGADLNGMRSFGRKISVPARTRARPSPPALCEEGRWSHRTNKSKRTSRGESQRGTFPSLLRTQGLDFSELPRRCYTS